MQLSVFPHEATLSVQIPYTLETHGLTIVYLSSAYVVHSSPSSLSPLTSWYDHLHLLPLPLVLSIHHVKRSNEAVATQREVHVLKMKLQEIMKGALLT